MGPDKGTTERGMGGELSLRRVSPIRPRRWEDTLDNRGIERPDET